MTTAPIAAIATETVAAPTATTVIETTKALANGRPTALTIGTGTETTATILTTGAPTARLKRPSAAKRAEIPREFRPSFVLVAGKLGA